MLNRIKLICFLFLCCLSIGNIPLHGQTNVVEPIGSDAGPVIFLGNSITYAGQYVAMTESLLLMAQDQSKSQFINLGLPSETVSGLSEPNHANGKFPRPCLFDRLDTLLDKVKPRLVFVCYGMNDGIYLPFDSSRFEAYQAGIMRLHDRLQHAGVKRIIWLTPPVHDDPKLRLQGYNQVLDSYASWLQTKAAKEQWEVVDLHFPMKAYLEEQLKLDSTFKLASDGIHPETLGHWLMAKTIIAHLLPGTALAPTWEQELKSLPKLQKIYPLVLKRQTIMKDAWLTHIGHKRPGMVKGRPIAEAQRIYQQLQLEIAALCSDLN